MELGCAHLESIKDVKPNSKGCEDCLKVGDTWVHLRYCKTCGYVGCCTQSKNKHSLKHYHEKGHPIIQSLEPGESWIWCYADEIGWE